MTTPRVTVPVEPTEAMMKAADAVDWSNEDERASVINMWQAMLSAVQEAGPDGEYGRADIRYGLHLIANEDCDEVAAAYYAKKTLAYLARREGAPAEEAELDARDHERIDCSLRTTRAYDAVRYLRDALSATTARLTGYDWNADPDGVTKQQGEAFSAADRVFADLDAAVASHPEIELPECQACGGTGKIEEAARTTGANQHSACVRTCDDCDGCGFAPDDEPEALATREEATAEAGEISDLEMRAFHAANAELSVSDYQCLVRDLWAAACNGTELTEGALTRLRAQPPAREDAQPVKCPRCYRGEVFGLSMDDGFWVEFSSASGGAHPAGMHGWLELAEHHPDGRMVVREYVAKDSPIYPAPDALRRAVEALIEAREDLFVKADKDEIPEQWASVQKIDQALAALQAEQKGGA